MIDVPVGPFQSPVLRIPLEMGLHVLVNKLLKVQPQAGSQRPHHNVCVEPQIAQRAQTSYRNPRSVLTHSGHRMITALVSARPADIEKLTAVAARKVNLFLRGGLKLREGFGRTATNNITVNNCLHPHVWYANRGDVFARNIVMGAYRPAIMNVARWGKQVDFNLFKTTEADRTAFAGQGCDANTLVGDLLFVDAAHGDFRVKEDSPPCCGRPWLRSTPPTWRTCAASTARTRWASTWSSRACRGSLRRVDRGRRSEDRGRRTEDWGKPPIRCWWRVRKNCCIRKVAVPQ